VAISARCAPQAEVVFRNSRRVKGLRAFRIGNAPFRGSVLDWDLSQIAEKLLYFKEKRLCERRLASCPYRWALANNPLRGGPEIPLIAPL